MDGDDEGLNGLMERYGNSLTFYINGYLHDLHESEDLMIDAFSYLIAKNQKSETEAFAAIFTKPPATWRCGAKPKSVCTNAFN